MRKNVWILLVVGVFALGVVAAGCGSDDETSATSVTLEDTDASTTVEGTDTSVTAEDTSGDGEVDTDEFLSECNDAVEGTPAEAAGQSACQQAADALEQCAGDANDDSAIAICQKAADEAVKQLQAAG